MLFGLDMDTAYLMAHLHPFSNDAGVLRGKLHMVYPCAFEFGVLRDGRPLGVVLDFDLSSDASLNNSFELSIYESTSCVIAVLSRVRYVKHQLIFGASGKDEFTYSYGFVKEPKIFNVLQLVHCNLDQGEPVDPRIPYNRRPEGVLMQFSNAKPVEARPIKEMGKRENLAKYITHPITIAVRSASDVKFRKHNGRYTDVQYYISGYVGR